MVLEDFICGTEGLLKQLSNLSDLSTIFMNAYNWSGDYQNLDLNLSGMSNLKKIVIKHFKFKSITLPAGIESIDIERLWSVSKFIKFK